MSRSALDRPPWRLWVLACCAAWPGLAAAEPVRVEQLCDCYVSGLNGDGSAAVGTMEDTGEVFRWTVTEELQRLGGALVTTVRNDRPSISADGRLVAATIGNATGQFDTQGLWRASTGWVELKGMRAGTTLARVNGLSGDGSVVAGERWDEIADGVSRSVATSATVLSGMRARTDSGYRSEARGVSDRGRVVVGVDVGGPGDMPHATVWTHARLEWLNLGWSEAAAVSADGKTVVGYQSKLDGSQYALIWRRSGGSWAEHRLPLLPGWLQARPRAVSDDGRTVVGVAYSLQTERNFGWVWTAAGGMQLAKDFFGGFDLGTDRRYRIQEVSAISRDGRVFGVVAEPLWGGNPPFYTSFLMEVAAPAGR